MGNICCPEKEVEGFASSGHRLGGTIEGSNTEPRTVSMYTDKADNNSQTLTGHSIASSPSLGSTVVAGVASMDESVREKMLQAATARAKKNEPKKKGFVYKDTRQSKPEHDKGGVDVRDWMS
jgi:hypothetical protein